MLTVIEYSVDDNGDAHAHHSWEVHYETREEAISAIERHLKKFDECGFDTENGSWWAKGKEGDLVVHRRFAVNGSGILGKRLK